MVSAVSRPPLIRRTTSVLTRADGWDHLLARWDVNRRGHRVESGLYAPGDPTPDSPVFATVNYTLGFDALRSTLAGVDGYITVLVTRCDNVWRAASKGTLGTDELVKHIQSARLHDVVRHRLLILPQLGAPGVAVLFPARGYLRQKAGTITGRTPLLPGRPLC
jgi:CO dehydrogenase/acetyl-CoA synthase gamma subunit (corrinoid Fe-S protein)